MFPLSSYKETEAQSLSDLYKDNHKFTAELHGSQDSLVCSAAHPVPQVPEECH